MILPKSFYCQQCEERIRNGISKLCLDCAYENRRLKEKDARREVLKKILLGHEAPTQEKIKGKEGGEEINENTMERS